MPRFLMVVIFLGLVAGIVAWAWIASRDSLEVAIELPAAAVVSVGTSVAAKPELEMASIDGVMIMDTSSGLPAVPFIQYQDAEGGMRTKQLIYKDMRGCYPGAGDMPCVPYYSGDSAYPQYSTGTRIRAEGYPYEDRLLVTSISSQN